MLDIQVLLKHSESQTFLKELRNEIALDEYALKPCCKELLTSLLTCNVLEIATKYEQGSSMWAKERQLRITGIYFLISWRFF